MKKLTTLFCALSLMTTSLVMGAPTQEDVLAKAHEIIETPITVSEEALLELREELNIPTIFTAECHLKGKELFSFLPHFESDRAFVQSIPNLPMSYSTVSFDLVEWGFGLLEAHSLFHSLALKQFELPTLYGIALCKDEYGDEELVIAKSLNKGKTIQEHLSKLNSTWSTDLSQAQEILYSFGHALASLHQTNAHIAPLHPIHKQLFDFYLNALESELTQDRFKDLPFTFQEIKNKITTYIHYKANTPYRQSYCGFCEELDDISYNPQNGTFAFSDLENIILSIDMQKRPIGNGAQDYISVMESLQALTKGNLSDEDYRSLVAAFDRGYLEAGGSLPSPQDTTFFKMKYRLDYFICLDEDDEINPEFFKHKCAELAHLLTQ